jgi:hypothetical protein
MPDELLVVLRRIAKDVRQARSYLFWLALPIYVMMVLGGTAAILMLLSR